MNFRAILLALAALCACFSMANPPLPYIDREVLVKFRPGFELAGASATAAIGGTFNGGVTQLNVHKVSLPATMSVSSAVTYYRSRWFTEFAEPNYIVKALFIPNDPMFASQYHHTNVHTPQGWDLTQGDPNVKIAVLDTGCDLSHPDLSTKMLAGWDFVDNDSDPTDENGHGTHVAGLAAAATNNGVGVAGTGFNCKIIPVRVLNAGGSGSWEGVASGITFAADRQAQVINLSLGGYFDSNLVRQAVDYAWARGCVIVCAAGNDNTTTKMYPAGYEKCIAVGASNSADAKADFSNFGDWVDVAAPGENILSTVPGGYANFSGTSMASPVCAGVVGLIWSQAQGTLSNAEIRALLENNCDNIGTWIVHGRINAFRAINIVPIFIELPIAPTLISATQGIYLGGNATSIMTVDGQFFQVGTVPAGAVGSVASATVTVQTTENIPAALRLKIQVNAQGGRTSTGFLYMWDWSLNRWFYVKAFPMNESSAGATQEATLPTPYARFASPTGEMRILVRSLTPLRLRTSFTLGVDRVQVIVRKRL